MVIVITIPTVTVGPSCGTILYVFILTYRASVWFLPSVPSHMDDQHVLSLEWLLLPRAIFPLTNERLLVSPNVVIVQMLKRNENIEIGNVTNFESY